METNKTVLILAALVVAITMTMGVLTPIIAESTSDNHQTNEGAGWIRFAYDSNENTSYTISINSSNLTITNNTDTQTPSGDSGNTILYADSNSSVWADSGTIRVLGKSNGSSEYWTASADLTITRDSNGVNITDGTNDTTYDSPSWAYIPISTGTYGFFQNGTAVGDSGKPMASVGGGNAGIYAYNDIFSCGDMDLSLITETDEDGKIIGTSWGTESDDLETANGPSLGMDLNPIVPEKAAAEPKSSGGLGAVPTPTYTDGDWGYDLMDVDGVQMARIVAYQGSYSTSVTIPATIGGYTVYAIGAGGFEKTVFQNSSTFSLTGLTISNGPKIIDEYAFHKCKISGTLVIPSSVESIKGYAFSSTTFTGTLTIPNTVTEIGNSAFNGCTGFTGSLIIPTGITSISDYAFSGCTGLTGTLTIPENITEIGRNAFYKCTGFTGLELPSRLTRIGISAFELCNGFVGPLVIPDTVTFIGSYAFSGCKGFTALTLPPTLPYIDSSTFATCINMTGPLVLPEGIRYIGSAAFGSTKFTGALKIPDGVEAIYDRAFISCTGFTSLELPESLTKIGASVFSGCTGFTGSLTIPSNLKLIDPNTSGATFKDCTGFNDTLYILSKEFKTTLTTFQNCTGFKTIVVSSDVVPSNNAYSTLTGVTKIVDLSDEIDYSVNRYGLPANAVISTTIGDSIGYISYTEIGEDAAISGPMATALMAVPVVILIGLAIGSMVLIKMRA